MRIDFLLVEAGIEIHSAKIRFEITSEGIAKITIFFKGVFQGF